MTPTNLPPRLGHKYRPLYPLGAGGMGSIFVVEHTGTGERLALKLLHAHARLDRRAVERFRREARIAVRLKSEHVVRVVDADVADELDGAPFLVMELLEGRDLNAVAGATPQPPAQVVEWLRQAAQALDRAHSLGIVHRDLKPENLFLTWREDGSPLVKVLDFGVAKMLSDDDPLGDGGLSCTTTGAVFGTPLYMSPEQAIGGAGAIGPPSDFWSLAMVAYRLLAGRPYWGVMTPAHVLAQIVYEPVVSPSARGCDLGEAFDRWFLRSCRRAPSSRWPSAGAQIEALAEALEHVQAPGIVPPSSRGRRAKASFELTEPTIDGAVATLGAEGTLAANSNAPVVLMRAEGHGGQGTSGSKGLGAAFAPTRLAAAAVLLAGAFALGSAGWSGRPVASVASAAPRGPSLEGASWDLQAGGSSWHVQEGEWYAEGDALIGRGGQIISSVEIGDGTLELDFELLEGPPSSIGVGFRMTPVLFRKDGGGYGANFRAGSDTFNLFRGVDGSWEEADRAFPDYRASPAIDPRTNHVVVRAQGQTFAVSVNGQPIGGFEDDTHRAGRVTLWVHSSKTRVRFSNLRVTPG